MSLCSEWNKYLHALFFIERMKREKYLLRIFLKKENIVDIINSILILSILLVIN